MESHDSPSHHQIQEIPGLPEIVFRLIFGTGVFALIVWAAAHSPAAAGLMLTFPALNGLAFIFSRYDKVSRITETMLWMPLINGMLCVAYLTVFNAWAAPQYAKPLAWGLALGLALLWLALVTRPCVKRGILPCLQPPYAMAVALSGIGLTFMWWYFSGTTNIGASGDAAKPELSELKVSLFVFALLLLIVLPPRFRWKDKSVGILSGLPLVSLAGLLSVAEDATVDLEVRLALLAQMMFGVWLAPAMAVTFIYAMSLLLAQRGAHRLRIAVIGAGWALCLAAILATATVLQWLASR